MGITIPRSAAGASLKRVEFERLVRRRRRPIPRSAAGASLKQVPITNAMRATLAHSPVRGRGLIEAWCRRVCGASSSRRHSPVRGRGLIEARAALTRLLGRWSHSPVRGRGLIEASGAGGAILAFLWNLHRDVADLRERMARLAGLFEGFTRREPAEPLARRHW